MSLEAMKAIFPLEFDRSTTKFVLLAFANCANDETWEAFPSWGYLCEFTSQDRKTVSENVRRLKDMGCLVDTGRRVGRTRQVVVYAVKLPENGTVKESQIRNSSESVTVPFFPGNSAVFPPKEYRKRNTEPKGTQKEPPLNKPRGAFEKLNFEQWESSLEEKGEKAISKWQPIWQYAERTGIPTNFINLAFMEFRERHRSGDGAKKKQSDWRLTFKNYVERGYLNLWYCAKDGTYELTTSGKQAWANHFTPDETEAAA